MLNSCARSAGTSAWNDPNSEDRYQSLEKYGRDLTALALKGKQNRPVIAGDDEVRRFIQVLARRTKNNPVLIGEPGVGTTAIWRAWPSGSSPATPGVSLKDKRVIPGPGRPHRRGEIPVEFETA